MCIVDGHRAVCLNLLPLCLQMKEKNHFGRLLALLLITLAGCLALYGLPERILGFGLKKVDLLSDIRIKPPSYNLDSLKYVLLQDSLLQDSLDRESLRKALLDSTDLAFRDSLYRVMHAVKGADSLGVHIEDYSPGHVGLSRFFQALNQIDSLGRPVRIAVLGDSFIEGDIVVADLRSNLQALFGGQGVGFVPIYAVTDPYRPTIKHKSVGWGSSTLLSDTLLSYTLSGLSFTASEGASLQISTSAQYPQLKEVPSVKLLYHQNIATRLRYTDENHPDTLHYPIPPTQSFDQYEVRGRFQEGLFKLSQTGGFRALGYVLEGDEGITVDNFSLRGNSGILLTRMDTTLSRDLAALRPYDLIVLQYGLNVVNEDMLQYGWYRTRMINAIQHVQACFPDADILLLGVSDRGQLIDDSYKTMPAVLALLHAQRQAARQTGITFWNTFGGMGGENSMARFVENNWASKDYTHLSFRGGREVAKALVKALLLEKDFYDKAEKNKH